MPGYSLIVFLCLFAAYFQHDVTGFKKTVFMSPVELAVHGHLSVGDIIENKITVPLENGTLLELPLYHKAIVVNPETLEIVHYRYKDENDTTEEELQKLKTLKSETTGRGTGNLVQNMLDSIVGQVTRDFQNAKSLDDIQRVKINCRGELKGGLMDMLHKYDPKNRKVYMDNLVENFGARPCRVNNELDLKWDPLPGELIARRAKSRVCDNLYII
ncbi:hypothetical protein Ddc_24254 [Ditylenchus destructor]|nr:hypothetical protein Ddc_24254 [Ditylenchus destructor]